MLHLLAKRQTVSLVAQSFAPFVLTGTTTETTAYQVTVPANTLKPNGRLRIYVAASSAAGRAGFWQYQIYFNGVRIFGQNNPTTVSGGSMVVDVLAVSNTSQIAIGANEGGTSTAAPIAFTADLTTDNIVRITMTNASAADTTTVIGHSEELMNP